MTYPNGDQIYMPNAFYLCRDFTVTLTAQREEVSQLAWFELEHLSENIFEPNQRVIDDFIQSQTMK